MSYLADMHIHSTFSFDGKMPAEDIAELAISKNIKYIALTEHLDLCTGSFQNYLDKLPQYFNTVDSLNEAYDGKLKILSSVEIAEPHLYKKEFEKIQSLNFDFILGAIHFIDGKSIAFKQLDINNAASITGKYYENVYNAVCYGGFDAFAHFDHIRRGVGGDYSKEETIKDIMKEMVKNNIALEINTSGIRRTKTAPFPDLQKVKIYKNCGGKNITIGSDTHIESNLYDNVSFVEESLEALNLNKGIFINRKFTII